jgi:peroxiredoxin (alkyl hydroperoxide reductase subunit C)
MKTVYDTLPKFSITGVRPGALSPDSAFETLTEKSFEGKWKVIVFYPKDFTFVCPTEIVEYDRLVKDFEDRDAVLLTGSTDNEFCKLAWRNAHDGLRATQHWQFADTLRGENSLAEALGVFDHSRGAALRATFIVDDKNVIQHVTANNLDVGRSAQEALRVLDGCQTQELCECNRPVGGKTLGNI